MAITVNFYNDFMKLCLNGTINCVTDSFRIILVNGYTYDGTHTMLSDAAVFEVLPGNGYNAGGIALASNTLTFSGNNTIFDADDALWSATGAGITATGAIIFSDTSANNMLGCYIDFGGSKTAVDNTNFLVAFNAGGIYKIAK